MSLKEMESNNSTQKLVGASNPRALDDVDIRAAEITQEAQRFLEEKGIRDKLFDAIYNDDRPPAEQFITLPRLSKIWTDQLLQDFLVVLGHHGSEIPLKHIQLSLIKTTSILVHMKWDKWSSFESIFFPDGWEMPPHQDRSDEKLPHRPAELKQAHFLGERAAKDFFNLQNTYMPVVIKQGKSSFVPKWQPLPFINSERKKLATGGFGVVTREVIAEGQFSGPRLDGNYNTFQQNFVVARKQFLAGRDFRKETKNLAMLAANLSSHERLVKHLAFITTGDDAGSEGSKEFNILLPMANTDLKKLLYEERFSSHCVDLVQLLTEACNVLDALTFLHKERLIEGCFQTFCHMDLKPDNILVYDLEDPQRPAGCWKISDFGISSTSERAPADLLRKISQRSPAASLAAITGNTAMITNQRAAGLYSAPEVHEGGMVGTSSDVWSFGCILTQILARGAGGRAKLLKMDEERETKKHDHFCQEDPVLHLHPAVQRWLDSHDFLGHSMDRKIILNCKELIKQALMVDTKKRATAEQLLYGLAPVCKQDRNPTESVAGSPTKSTGPFSRHTSRLEPSNAPSLQKSPPAPSNSSPNQHFAEPPPQSDRLHAVPILRTPNYQSSPKNLSIPQIQPPTPPDDQPGFPPANTTSRATNGDPAQGVLSALTKHGVRHRILEGVSSHLPENALGVLNTFSPSTSQPTSKTSVHRSSAKEPPHIPIIVTDNSMTRERLASESLDQRRSASIDPRGLSASNQDLDFSSHAVTDQQRRFSNNTVAGISHELGSRAEDNPAQKTRKMFSRILLGKHDKARSQSLPALPDNTFTQLLSSLAQKDLPPVQRPPNNSTRSGPSALQYPRPYTESVASINEDNREASNDSGPWHSSIPSSYTLDKLEGGSTSSDATSGPRGEPVPKNYWKDVAKSKQIARARSNRSSVPSVNVGDAKTHNFLNVSKQTIMTLVSSTAAKVAFIAPKGVDIATLYDPNCKNDIEAPNGIDWERGSLAGNYLALQGYSNTNQTYPLCLYELWVGRDRKQPDCPQILNYQEIRLPRLPPFEKFDISRDGMLLLGSSSKIYLGSFNDEPYELEPSLKPKYNLRRVWFSTSGLIAFAWSSGPSNRHRINWWEVENFKQRSGKITHQLVNSQATADRIKVIHFPKSPLCLLWQDHEFYLLQEAEKPSSFQLQECPIVDPVSVVVTPNEDAVVFIRYSGGLKRSVSKILICPIRKVGDYFYIDYNYDKKTGQPTLQNHIREPDKCEVVIEEYEGSNRDIKVLIAQRNGSFEVKNMQIPA